MSGEDNQDWKSGAERKTNILADSNYFYTEESILCMDF